MKQREGLRRRGQRTINEYFSSNKTSTFTKKRNREVELEMDEKQDMKNKRLKIE